MTRYRVIDGRGTVDSRRFPSIYETRPYALQHLEPSRYGAGTWAVVNLYATRDEAKAARERLRRLAPAC